VLFITSRGDLQQARQVIESALAHVDSAQVFALLPQGLYRFLLAALGNDYFRALQRLARPSAVLDSGSYFLGRAETWRWEGRPELARPYYDSARVWWERRVAARPDDPLGFSELGVANAGLGNREAALRAGRTAVNLVPISKDGHRGPTWALYLAQIEVMVGDQDDAIEQLAEILRHPSLISRAFLRVHPVFAPLRSHPRFSSLVGR
jgi:tetratricopeptide (TPR) repeat protein